MESGRAKIGLWSGEFGAGEEIKYSGFLSGSDVEQTIPILLSGVLGSTLRLRT